jgi:uncharacterized membrane protein YeaQ/YmgE (transglycosylase-associated protein family)
MGVLLWVLCGLLIGTAASLLMRGQRRAATVALTLVMAALGALLGGFIGRALGFYPRTLHVGAIAMAAGGAVVLLALYHALFAQRRVY